MNVQTNQATATDGTLTEDWRAQLEHHIVGLLGAMRESDPAEVGWIIRETLGRGAPRVLAAMDAVASPRRQTWNAEVTFLREIESAAMKLLEFSVDAGLEDGRNVVAEEAARVFAHVRLCMPPDAQAQHWVDDDEDTADVAEGGVHRE